MRVRIIKQPERGSNDVTWEVQSRKWWQFNWHREYSFYGEDSKQPALQYARQLLGPEIIEVTK